MNEIVKKMLMMDVPLLPGTKTAVIRLESELEPCKDDEHDFEPAEIETHWGVRCKKCGHWDMYKLFIRDRRRR